MSLLKHCRLTSVGVGEIDLDLKNDDNMTDSEKLQDLKSQIKALDQKKTTLTDAVEIKAINKKINALQEEFGRLRKEIQYRKSYEKSVEMEFVHCVVGGGVKRAALGSFPNDFPIFSGFSCAFNTFFIFLHCKKVAKFGSIVPDFT